MRKRISHHLGTHYGCSFRDGGGDDTNVARTKKGIPITKGHTKVALLWKGGREDTYVVRSGIPCHLGTHQGCSFRWGLGGHGGCEKYPSSFRDAHMFVWGSGVDDT